MLGCIQPMSSPMMNRTLGFACGEPGACGCDCAKLDKLAAAVAMPKLTRPSESFLSSTELAGMGSLLCYHDPAQGRPPAAGHRSDHACPERRQSAIEARIGGLILSGLRAGQFGAGCGALKIGSSTETETRHVGNVSGQSPGSF